MPQEAVPLPDTSDAEAKLVEARAVVAAHRARLADIEQELLAHHRAALTNEHTASRARALVEDSERRATELADAVARLRRERDAAVQARRTAVAGLAAWVEAALRAGIPYVDVAA